MGLRMSGHHRVVAWVKGSDIGDVVFPECVYLITSDNIILASLFYLIINIITTITITYLYIICTSSFHRNPRQPGNYKLSLNLRVLLTFIIIFFHHLLSSSPSSVYRSFGVINMTTASLLHCFPNLDVKLNGKCGEMWRRALHSSVSEAVDSFFFSVINVEWLLVDVGKKHDGWHSCRRKVMATIRFSW